jgi:hypothetical protein
MQDGHGFCSTENVRFGLSPRPADRRPSVDIPALGRGDDLVDGSLDRLDKLGSGTLGDQLFVFVVDLGRQNPKEQLVSCRGLGLCQLFSGGQTQSHARETACG